MSAVIYESFPVEENDYFYQVMRYVERNALRAGLVDRAEAWRWGSLWRRLHGTPEQRAILCPWPVAKPRQWAQLVNEPQHETEVKLVHKCVVRGQPFGSDSWVATIHAPQPRTTSQRKLDTQQLWLQATAKTVECLLFRLRADRSMIGNAIADVEDAFGHD